MAHVDIDLLASLLTGSINNEITIYKRGGKLIVAKKRGASKKEPTPNQLAARKRMAAAVRYAKAAMLDPDLKRRYEKMAEKGQNAFNMAVKTWFTFESGEEEVKTVARIVRRTNRMRPVGEKLLGTMMVMDVPLHKFSSS